MEVVEQRRDAFRPKVERTREGYARMSGIAAVPGVLVYHYPDGRVVKELVLEETLRSDQNLNTLKSSALCSGHPAEPVTAANWREHSRGFVEVACWDEQEQGTRVVVLAQDGEIITEITEEGLEELSPGYEVGIKKERGVHPLYGEYDQIQVWRKNNHLAAVHSARGGQRARLHLDSQDADAPSIPDNCAVMELRQDAIQAQEQSEKTMSKRTIEIMGAKYELEPDAAFAIQRLDEQRRSDASALESMQKKLDAYQEAIGKNMVKRDQYDEMIKKYQDELDALRKQIETLLAPPAPPEKPADAPAPDAPQGDMGGMPKQDMEMEEAAAFGELLEGLGGEMSEEEDMTMTEDKQDAADKPKVKSDIEIRKELVDTAVEIVGFKADGVKNATNVQIKRAVVANALGKGYALNLDGAKLDEAYTQVIADLKARKDQEGKATLNPTSTTRRDGEQADKEELEAKRRYLARLQGKNID